MGRRYPIALLLSVLGFVAVAAVCYGQTNYSNQTIKWDDYTFKFLAGGQMAQVLTADGKVIGSILMMNGELRVLPLPGPDGDKLKKSFEDWKTYEKRAHPASGASATPAPAGQSPSGTTQTPESGEPAKVTFNESNEPTVIRPDGVKVEFGEVQIRIAGYHAMNYILRHEKATTGRVLRNATGPFHVGTSVSGAGEQYLVEGGAMFFDSAQGVNVGNARFDKLLLLPKQLSVIAMDAVAEVRKIPGHEKFTPTGYNDFKQVSEYRLKSDGSQH